MENLDLGLLTRKIKKCFDDVFASSSWSKKLSSELKADRSIITKIDKEISDIVKKEVSNLLDNGWTFFSEEDHLDLDFPAIILDPIDGTRELSQGIGECSVSLAFAYSSDLSDPKNRAMLYNPFTGYTVTTEDLFIKAPSFYKSDFLGMLSRSEWKKGEYFDIEAENIRVVPRGSIAFKLGLLASGACDFVFTTRPKNIWDIFAGTILCNQRGILAYNRSNEFKKLESVKIDGPIIWTRPELIEELKGALEL